MDLVWCAYDDATSSAIDFRCSSLLGAYDMYSVNKSLKGYGRFDLVCVRIAMLVPSTNHVAGMLTLERRSWALYSIRHFVECALLKIVVQC